MAKAIIATELTGCSLIGAAMKFVAITKQLGETNLVG